MSRTMGLALVWFVVACGDDGAGPPGGADDGGGGSADGGGGAADAGVGAGCRAEAPAPPLDEERTLEHGGLTRTFFVHVPASYDGSPTPVVLNFHGFTSNAMQQAAYSMMIDKSDAAGFIAVHAEGTQPLPGTAQRWNAGACCPDGSSTVDDVGFVAAILDDVSSRTCLDPRRIYATGLSNGGMMSHRLGCQLSDRIAAIAPVAGTLVLEPCEPARPVPVMAFHGTADPILSYDGVVFPGAPASHMAWRDLDGCTGDAVETFQMGDSACSTYQTCQGGAEVTLCTITGGGHTWPGADVNVGATTQDLDATDAMWDFFTRHPLP